MRTPKLTVIRSCIIVGTLILAAHCTQHAHAATLDCSTQHISHPASKYDELISYEFWGMDDLMSYLQWGLFTPETEDEYILSHSQHLKEHSENMGTYHLINEHIIKEIDIPPAYIDPIIV